MSSSWNEDSRVKIPTVLHLTKLGYDYVSKNDQNIDPDTNIFKDIFYQNLKNNNPDLKTSDTGWGRRYGISIEKLEDLIISDFGYEFVGHHKDLGGVASWDKIYKYSDEVTFKKIGETDIE